MVQTNVNKNFKITFLVFLSLTFLLPHAFISPLISLLSFSFPPSHPHLPWFPSSSWRLSSLCNFSSSLLFPLTLFPLSHNLLFSRLLSLSPFSSCTLFPLVLLTFFLSLSFPHLSSFPLSPLCPLTPLPLSPFFLFSSTGFKDHERQNLNYWIRYTFVQKSFCVFTRDRI